MNTNKLAKSVEVTYVDWCTIVQLYIHIFFFVP